MRQGFFDNYPNLFQSLLWWSDRKPEDMPEYVKIITSPMLTREHLNVGAIVNVFKHFSDSGSGHNANGCQVFGNDYMSYSRGEPATEEEYTAYINQKQQ